MESVFEVVVVGFPFRLLASLVDLYISLASCEKSKKLDGNLRIE